MNTFIFSPEMLHAEMDARYGFGAQPQAPASSLRVIARFLRRERETDRGQRRAA